MQAMALYKGYYSLIQFCPDPSRLEAANVGVLLFCPELRFVRARLSHDNRRIDKFFGHQDWDLVKAQKQAVVERLMADAAHFRTLEDLQDYASRRANEIQLSPARPLKVQHAEKALEDLFQRLVGEHEHRDRGHRATTLFREAVTKAGLEPMLKKDVTVTVPTIGRQMTAPYGYQNGRFNLIEPERFDASDSDGVFNRAYPWAVKGQLLFESPHPEFGPLQLAVVGQFGDESQAEAESVRTIFGKHSVKLYTFDDLPALFDDVRKSASGHRAV
jgi:Protein of unknown function (DUF3037)